MKTPSSSSSEQLQKLSDASVELIETDIDYKSGANYKGCIKGIRKAGKGTFTWHDGSQYIGEFLNDQRHGQGKQIWPDGSYYDGDFVNDLRHGIGKHVWSSGEVYDGQFHKDHRHGNGTYFWSDGSKYSGSVSLNKREGYGIFIDNCGNKYEGLYKQDEREGPGVLTYTNGNQDVGLWLRERLARICWPVSHSFTIKNFPELQYIPAEHYKYISISSDFNQVNSSQIMIDVKKDYECLSESSPSFKINSTPYFNSVAEIKSQEDLTTIQPVASVSIVPSQEDFANSESYLEQEKSYSSQIRVESNLVNNDIYDRSLDRKKVSSSAMDIEDSSQPHAGATLINSTDVVAWNNTPLLIAMQIHIMKFAECEKNVNFDVGILLQGERNNFCHPGIIEQASKELFQLVGAGDLGKVEEILDNHQAYVDVSDKTGFTSLMLAAINGHITIINSLLDHGADINCLNDEGMSALSMCHVLYYPAVIFRPNIAENNKSSVIFEQEVIIPKRISSRNSLARSKTKSNTPEQLTVRSTLQNYQKEYKISAKETKLEKSDNLISDSDVVENASNGKIQASEQVAINIFDEFSSHKSQRDLSINVSDELIDKCAKRLSANEMVVNKQRSTKHSVQSIGTARRLAMDKARSEEYRSVIQLLLRRGADPNVSSVPMQVLFFAVKAADVEAVQLLLAKNASVNIKLSDKFGGLTPLHIASALPGNEGIEITRLLLAALADPNVRAVPDDSYINKNAESANNKSASGIQLSYRTGGRTALHIACSRDDNYNEAAMIVNLLLKQAADPNLLCNGHSALSLAIASGNDMAIDEILACHPNLNLPLTHGVCSALCAAVSTEYEFRRSPERRIHLVDKLITAGADVLMLVPIGPKQIMGTVVDYAYYIHNLDHRIAHMPYHALSPAERDIFNYRRNLQIHLADILRTKAIERERLMNSRLQSRSPSPNFLYIKNGNFLPGTARIRGSRAFVSSDDLSILSEGEIRKPLFSYCYECGRSVMVHLQLCSRCKSVYFCSKTCKMKSWTSRHKDECLRLCGISPSSGDKADLLSKASSNQKGTSLAMNRNKFTANSANNFATESNNARKNSKNLVKEKGKLQVHQMSGTQKALASASLPNISLLSKRSLSEISFKNGQKIVLDSNSYPWIPANLQTKKVIITNYSLV